MLRWIYKLPLRLRSVFNKGGVENDLSDELRFHLEKQIEQNIASGMSTEEARYAALREFGGVEEIKEQCRDSWGVWFVNEFAQDTRYGLRQLRRNPGFTAVAVLTLALGIAANTTIFSAVSAILLRKPPVKDPDSLCSVSSKYVAKGYDLLSVSPLDFESWRRRNDVFQAMAAVIGGSFTFTGKGGAESVFGDLVTPGYFKVIGVLPVLGRPFLPSEGQAGGNHVVVLSNALWHDRFASDPSVIGKNLEINNEPYTVVGVMPPKAAMPMPWVAPRLWTPLVFSAKDMSPSGRGNLDLDMVLGRLRPGVTIQKAQAEMSSIAHQLARSYPKTNKGRGVTVLTLQDYLIRKPHTRNAMMMLMVVVGLVLLIACANIAGLLLARGASRAHELAVRSAVGASRFRLVRQMLAESLLIGVAGGGLGLLMSVWGIELLRAGFSFNEVARRMAAGFRLDQPTLLFTLGVTLLTTFVLGLVPALRASKANPRDALAEGGRADSGGLGRSRLRSVLVTGEVALSLVLLAGAGVMMREVIREFAEPIGFNPSHLLVADVFLKSRSYEKPAAQGAFFRQVTENLRNIASAESAGASTCIFNGCDDTTAFSIAGEPPLPKSKRPSADWFAVGPGYFGAMQIPLMKGREFTDSDNAHAPIVAIINRAFASRFFPKGNAIGQQIEVDRGKHKQARIVGIVANIEDYIGQLAPRAQIYECYLQVPSPSMWLVVRSRVAPSALAHMLRHAVWSVDKSQPIGTIQTMQERIADNVGGDKLLVKLLGIFAALALLLAAVGIYGVVAYSVNQRTREIGIRVALGAEKRDVLRLVLKQGGLLTGIGCAIGLALALPLPHIFSSLFSGSGFGNQGPLVAVTAFFFIGTVCLGATYLPARRAAKVNPMVALRYE